MDTRTHLGTFESLIEKADNALASLLKRPVIAEMRRAAIAERRGALRLDV